MAVAKSKIALWAIARVMTFKAEHFREFEAIIGTPSGDQVGSGLLVQILGGEMESLVSVPLKVKCLMGLQIFNPSVFNILNLSPVPKQTDQSKSGSIAIFLKVLIFLLNITPEDQRKNDKITAVLAKEIQLKHRAPVIDIVVFDSGGLPVSGTISCHVIYHRLLVFFKNCFPVFLLYIAPKTFGS